MDPITAITVQILILIGTVLAPFLQRLANRRTNDVKLKVNEALANKTDAETLDILGHIVGDQAAQISRLNKEINALKDKLAELNTERGWLSRARYIIRTLAAQVEANGLPLSVVIPQYLNINGEKDND